VDSNETLLRIVIDSETFIYKILSRISPCEGSCSIVKMSGKTFVKILIYINKEVD